MAYYVDHGYLIVEAAAGPFRLRGARPRHAIDSAAKRCLCYKGHASQSPIKIITLAVAFDHRHTLNEENCR